MQYRIASGCFTSGMDWLALAKSVTSLIAAEISEPEAFRTVVPKVLGASKETDLFGGGKGFRGSTFISRAFRDMDGVTNHLFVDPVHLVKPGPAIPDRYRAGLTGR